MYGYLKHLLGEPAATLLSAVWFAGLICLILYLSVEPQGDFRYGRY